MNASRGVASLARFENARSASAIFSNAGGAVAGAVEPTCTDHQGITAATSARTAATARLNV